MFIYVLIPVHNRIEYTNQCLLSLENQSIKSFQIIVIDDGSTDGTKEMIYNNHPEVKVLIGNGNLWWTGAINLGIEYVLHHSNPEDCILLLNDDLIVSEDLIAKAYESASKYPNTLIGSVVINKSDKQSIFSGGVIINWATAKWLDPNRGKRITDFPVGFTLNVSTLTGRGVLIPISVFGLIGLYDSKHFVQCGDTEFPIRASKIGYKLLVDYSLVVFNNVNQNEHISDREIYNISDAKDYFFSIKSHSNLNNRFWFAIRTSRNFFSFLRYYFLDLIRTTMHFLLRLRLG